MLQASLLRTFQVSGCTAWPAPKAEADAAADAADCTDEAGMLPSTIL